MPRNEVLYPDEQAGPFIIRQQGDRFEIYNVDAPDELIGRAPNLQRAQTFVDEIMTKAPTTGALDTIPGAQSVGPPQPQPVQGGGQIPGAGGVDLSQL